jgi:hypothetical protein
MEEQVVSLETAKLLKEKGFVNGSQSFYDVNKGTFYVQISLYINGLDENFIEAPTQSLAQKWVRDKKKMHMGIGHRRHYLTGEDIWSVVVEDIECKNPYRVFASLSHLSSYEEALEEGLKAALNYEKEVQV